MDLRDKKILVTGADGFIGSHLVERLQAEGARVRAFTYYNSFNSWGWLDTLSREQLGQIEVVCGDVRDAGCVEAAVGGCEVVLHLAALIAIPFSYVAPESYVDTNIKGTLNVLQAARKAEIARLVVTSTSEVYGTAQYVPIDEKHPFQGQSPYSATKIGADRLAEAFYRSFATPVIIARPFNTYGPRQSARAVIPTIITQLLSGSAEIRLGNLHPTRDLVFVKDTVEALLALTACDAAVGQEVNIAIGQEISVRDLARQLIQQINPRARLVEDQERIRPKDSEVERLLGCPKRLQALTGWRPRYSLAEGLAETVAWLRVPAHLARYKAWLYNI
jgi:NAD dependent epimerase/dehydratase